MEWKNINKPEFKEIHEYGAKPGDIRYNNGIDRLEYFDQSWSWRALKLEDYMPPYVPPYKINPDMPGYVDKLGSHYRLEDIIDTILVLMMQNGIVRDLDHFRVLLNNKMNAKALADKLSEME